MAVKSFLTQLLAAAVVSAAPFGDNNVGFPPSPNVNPFCTQIQQFAPLFPLQSTVASSFCTSYFSITPHTNIVQATTVTSVTSTSSAIATVSVTPTITSYVSTQTCFQNTATASPPHKVKRSPEAEANLIQNPVQNIYYSSACSCFGVNLSPLTTVTAQVTATSYVATTIVYTATVTGTAAAQTATATLTTYVPSNGTYTSSDGSTFADYTGFDFYGYDLYSSFCAPRGTTSSTFSTPLGNYTCNDYTDCQDVCASYNDANIAQGGSAQACKGVTYNVQSTFCYLKYAVPGNGAPNCSPNVNAADESAILLVQD